MSTKSCGCDGTGLEENSKEGVSPIVDRKTSLLIAAGAAMAANCEPCLNKIVPELIEAGVADVDIRKAVVIGQMVKDKPASLMKEAADVLTGSNLSDKSTSQECAFERAKREMACCG